MIIDEHTRFEAALHAFKEEIIVYNAYLDEDAKAVSALIDVSVKEGKIVFLKDACYEKNKKVIPCND